MKVRRGLVPFLPLTILVVTMLQGVATAYETSSVAAAVPPIARQNVLLRSLVIAGLPVVRTIGTTGAARLPKPNLVILTVPHVVAQALVVVVPSTPARG
jgi:hypothetical protein